MDTPQRQPQHTGRTDPAPGTAEPWSTQDAWTEERKTQFAAWVAQNSDDPYIICLHNCVPYEECPIWQGVTPNLDPRQCEHWPAGIKCIDGRMVRPNDLRDEEMRAIEARAEESRRQAHVRQARLRAGEPRHIVYGGASGRKGGYMVPPPRPLPERWNPLELAVATFFTVGAVVTLLVWAGGML